MPNNKTMTTIKKILVSSKENTQKTHGSMGNIKGSYGLNREDIHYIFSNYYESDKYIGLQEKPRGYTMLRGDFDFRSTNLLNENEFDLEAIAYTFSNTIRKFLNLDLVKTKKTRLILITLLF